MKVIILTSIIFMSNLVNAACIDDLEDMFGHVSKDYKDARFVISERIYIELINQCNMSNKEQHTSISKYLKENSKHESN